MKTRMWQNEQGGLKLLGEVAEVTAEPLAASRAAQSLASAVKLVERSESKVGFVQHFCFRSAA
jgi:ABC-type transporter Mla MlaB component